MLIVTDCVAVLILGLSEGLRHGGMVVKILFEHEETQFLNPKGWDAIILTRVFGSFLPMKKEQMYRATQNVVISNFSLKAIK